MKKIVICILIFIGSGIWIAMAQNLPNKSLEIKNTAVPTEQDAKTLAFKAYCDKMQGNVLAEESATNVSIIKLGFDIPDFANKSEKIWEVRVEYFYSQLRAILWVHPMTEKVHFVIGPWKENSKER